MKKPVIKKVNGKWCHDGHSYDQFAFDFINRLNQRDTGYKDYHGCTIRDGDRLYGMLSGYIWNYKFLSVLPSENKKLSACEIIRHNNNRSGLQL